MKLLFDTHLLLWALAGSDHLPERALGMLLDPNVEPLFSAASIWEIAKYAAAAPIIWV
ncbi:hypothetical protein ACFPU0_25380 [Pseudomonas sp. GCM10022186]|uniref:hypothetical protein n=1 Tax=Pseudomonas sp. GCM10022186 TaxID=3252650 RepID=UPI003608A029